MGPEHMEHERHSAWYILLPSLLNAPVAGFPHAAQHGNASAKQTSHRRAPSSSDLYAFAPSANVVPHFLHEAPGATVFEPTHALHKNVPGSVAQPKISLSNAKGSEQALQKAGRVALAVRSASTHLAQAYVPALLKTDSPSTKDSEQRSQHNGRSATTVSAHALHMKLPCSARAQIASLLVKVAAHPLHCAKARRPGDDREAAEAVAISPSPASSSSRRRAGLGVLESGGQLSGLRFDDFHEGCATSVAATTSPRTSTTAVVSLGLLVFAGTSCSAPDELLRRRAGLTSLLL
mmetsp:Transcript_88223/g.248326  ORF Transcript_88223/g.248326 Transcript_88223/m.248326 type:complete len:292 (+) Transcript_88223:1409-2284(+)